MNPEDDLRPESHEKISNPTPVTGGVPRESAEDASRRGGERLRHRDRAVSFWDYERMVLEEFPAVYKIAAAFGAILAMVLTGWMLSDIKGPQGRVGPDPVLQLATSTPTPVSASPTTAPPDSAGTSPAVVTERPTAAPTATPQPIEINFNADSYTVVQGECTTLRWEVLGAESVRLLGAEVEHTGAEQACPSVSTTYHLLAENESESAESSFLIEVLVPTATPERGCSGYDQNGQLVCKTTCGPNDPGDPCDLD